MANEHMVQMKLTQVHIILNNYEVQQLLPTLKYTLQVYIRFSNILQHFLSSSNIESATIYSVVNYVNTKHSYLKLDNRTTERLKSSNSCSPSLISILTNDDPLDLDNLDCTTIAALLIKTLDLMNDGKEAPVETLNCKDGTGPICSKRRFICKIREFRNCIKHPTAVLMAGAENLIQEFQTTNKLLLTKLKDDIKYILKQEESKEELSDVSLVECSGSLHCEKCSLFRHVSNDSLKPKLVFAGLRRLEKDIDRSFDLLDGTTAEIMKQLKSPPQIQHDFEQEMKKQNILKQVMIPSTYEIIHPQYDATKSDEIQSSNILSSNFEATFFCNAFPSDLYSIYIDAMQEGNDSYSPSLVVYIKEWHQQDIETLVEQHIKLMLPNCFSKYNEVLFRYLNTEVNKIFVVDSQLWFPSKEDDKRWKELFEFFTKPSGSCIRTKSRWIFSCSGIHAAAPEVCCFIQVKPKTDQIIENYLQSKHLHELIPIYTNCDYKDCLCSGDLIYTWIELCKSKVGIFTEFDVCQLYLSSLKVSDEDVQIIQEYAFNCYFREVSCDDGQRAKLDKLCSRIKRLVFSECLEFRIDILGIYLAGIHLSKEFKEWKEIEMNNLNSRVIFPAIHYCMGKNIRNYLHDITFYLKKMFLSVEQEERTTKLKELDRHILCHNEFVDAVGDFLYKFKFKIDVDKETESSIRTIFRYLKYTNQPLVKELYFEVHFCISNYKRFLKTLEYVVLISMNNVKCHLVMKIKDLEANEKSTDYSKQAKDFSLIICEHIFSNLYINYKGPKELERYFCKEFWCCKAMSDNCNIEQL